MGLRVWGLGLWGFEALGVFEKDRRSERQTENLEKRKNIVLEALGSPWVVQSAHLYDSTTLLRGAKDVSGATRDFDPTRQSKFEGGVGLATSLRLGGSEDLKHRSEAAQDLTRRWVGELLRVAEHIN